MIEKVYYNETDFVQFDIPDRGAIGTFISGGADSSLMTFILAHTIQKHGLPTKVFPITGELLNRPFNLRCASDVIRKVEQLTGFRFGLHPCFIIPNHREDVTDAQKIEIMSSYTREYARSFQLTTIFNGLTANPPLSVLPDSRRAHRQSCRDDLNWRREQEKKIGLSVPFIHVDKRVIGQLYRRFNLVENLLPLTRSCESEMIESQYFTKVCSEIRPKDEACWWCREREYGFATLDETSNPGQVRDFQLTSI